MLSARAGVIVALAVMLAACGDGGTDPGGNPNPNPNPGTCTSTSANITVNNNTFSPNCTRVNTGTQVTWTWGNNASNGHNVTFTTGPNSTTETTAGFTFQRTFGTAGTFTYGCTVHPGMNGSIIVQ